MSPRSTLDKLPIAIGSALLGLACGGTPFATAAEGDAGGPGGGSSWEASSDPTSHPGAEGGAADTGARDGCLELRGGDAPAFDRELCLESDHFMMGSDTPNLGAGYADHTPSHAVHLSRFILDAYEVTVARYRACIAAGRCTAPQPSQLGGCTFSASPAGDEDRPITCVSWADAASFCAWDGGRRLPTEAEWEYAARGSAGRDYPWGVSFRCNLAVIGGGGACPEYAGEKPRPVGSTPAGLSPDGAFDLTGNVGEWVADWAGSFRSSASDDPTGPASGVARVVRGGGWRNIPPAGLGFARATSAPEARGPWGLRCARRP